VSELVGVLKAAGESTRLRLLALLADGDHSVKDLTEILDQSQPRVSRHLKLLADAGLIQRHAEGAWAYYGLAPHGHGAELARWLVARIDHDNPERQRDRDRQAAAMAAQQALATAYFAKVADSWDLLKTLHVPEEAVEAALLELLAPIYKRAIGVDSSREMLAVARSRLASAGVNHAQVRLGDIAALDTSIGQADVVVIHQVLHYFDDPGRMLAQARRLLRRGGEILIVDFAPHALEFLRTDHAHRRLGLSREQMTGWAEAAGLRVQSVREFPSKNTDGGLTVCLWRLSDRTDTE
jgi:ArsR family transcriptional regulator